MHSQRKYWKPYISPYDPCYPKEVKSYVTPPNLYLGFQPPNLPQYPTAKEALFRGTLWPALFSPYEAPDNRGDRDE
ncbi:spore coat associated protein CotJA [Radiobacillus kanasensis]|uniref:spore coat associated protein CotJA n=1 Tax=Radiobacillus kanasensis TaxID=2844358 RepID=UPI001E2B11AD|nr:spore coat associated protein CotJA [Radiobacillus kanasensis]UFT97651.1 spore coat associated protein CotJA [Radiobacillus kanasensis]